jgi:hypothetical protein
MTTTKGEMIIEKNDRFRIVFETKTKTLRVINNEKTEPLIKEEIEGTTTISQFCDYVENIKRQLGL